MCTSNLRTPYKRKIQNLSVGMDLGKDKGKRREKVGKKVDFENESGRDGLNNDIQYHRALMGGNNNITILVA